MIIKLVIKTDYANNGITSNIGNDNKILMTIINEREW